MLHLLQLQLLNISAEFLEPLYIYEKVYLQNFVRSYIYKNQYL